VYEKPLQGQGKRKWFRVRDMKKRREEGGDRQTTLTLTEGEKIERRSKKRDTQISLNKKRKLEKREKFIKIDRLNKVSRRAQRRKDRKKQTLGERLNFTVYEGEKKREKRERNTDKNMCPVEEIKGGKMRSRNLVSLAGEKKED